MRKLGFIIGFLLLACIEVPFVMAILLSIVTYRFVIPLVFLSVFAWAFFQFKNTNKIKGIKLFADFVTSIYSLVTLWFVAEALMGGSSLVDYYKQHNFVFSVSVIGLTASIALKLSVSSIEVWRERKPTAKEEPEQELPKPNATLPITVDNLHDLKSTVESPQPVRQFPGTSASPERKT